MTAIAHGERCRHRQSGPTGEGGRHGQLVELLERLQQQQVAARRGKRLDLFGEGPFEHLDSKFVERLIGQ